ncbi:MAG: HAMP domain-containing histidine kinase [Lachnospiraceae bacterium]|nr:HAMP domain-containing histidine kinase [Lachnospiraceae bacterium]
MRKTLYLKFVLAYILFGIFGFIVVATFVARMTMERCRREEAAGMYREAMALANTYAADLYNSEVSLDTVQDQITMLASYLDSKIWIVNPSGRLVVTSDERVPDPSSEEYIENFSPVFDESRNYVTGDFFGSFNEEYLSVLAPITSDFKIRGYVVVHTKTSRIAARANALLNISYLELLMLLLLSLIILIFFTEIIYIPLRKITTGAEQYAAGNWHYRTRVDSDDEMGYLSDTLNYMAGEIAGAEDDQKKFIANVSHDFRSPLTSIRGFLEAMLDGTIPPESHDKYLNVVLQETERLTKLTNSLLSINSFGSTGMLLTYTDFDINRVIRDIALSFEQTCRAKNISIDLLLSGDELYCSADKEKIEQVLYNLIDNAIKFSPASSRICVETTERQRDITVSVKDNGVGIPSDEQKLIWSRFYKSDQSRGRDKKGTGLGLSIVREIIQAHGETINLISTVDVGSEFVFTLKRSGLNDEL